MAFLGEPEKTQYLVPTWLAFTVIIVLSLGLSIYALWASHQALVPLT